MLALWKRVEEVFPPNPHAKYKRCGRHLLELKDAPNTITNETRTNVKDARFAKFRASRLIPTKIYDLKNDIFIEELYWSFAGHSIVYKVDQEAIPHEFDLNCNNVCVGGVHYFHSLVAAFFFAVERLSDDIDFEDNGSIRRIYKQNKAMSEEQWLIYYFHISNPIWLVR